jgi:hypothetical protein
MSARVELDPGPVTALDGLEKARLWDLLGAIEDAIEALGDDPGSRESRKRAFAGGTFGIPVRDRDEDWLIVWEPEQRAEKEQTFSSPGRVPVLGFVRTEECIEISSSGSACRAGYGGPALM